MIKTYLYYTLFVINVIAILIIIAQTVLAFNGLSQDEFEIITNWRINTTLLVFPFWIWNIIIWSTKDKRVGQLLGLFFLNGLYTLFYFRLVLKNNWLDNKE